MAAVSTATVYGISKVPEPEAVVELFSDEYQRHPEWTVPELLRRLCEQAWETLENEVNENTCGAYLAIFLHVYYGNPMTRLGVCN